jgi:predicted transposase/invertase (TIGR01784 family)
MLHKVISISILDFVLFPKHTPFHSCFMLRENSHPDLVLSQDCVMHYLECPKLRKEPASEVEQWLYLLLHAGEEDERMHVLIDQNEYFKKVMDRYRYFVSDEQARLAYESRQKFLHDQASNIAEARDLGLEEGRVQGREEEKMEIASNLHSLGFSTEQIVQATGLSVKEVEELAGSA